MLQRIISTSDKLVPLIINGEDYTTADNELHFCMPADYDPTSPSKTTFQAADAAVALKAIDGAQKAFSAWRQTSVSTKRLLFNRMAEWLRSNEDTVKKLIKDEIHCDDDWASIQCHGGISVLEESAAIMSSEAAAGQILPSVVEGATAMIFPEPYGVILGIAPWNAPLILGLRAICAPLAAGNTVIFKGSEVSPKTHFLIASLFRAVGGPPGVCNFLLHRPQDAIEVFDTCIAHASVKKVNFTGSTAVGRSIAVAAAKQLKPVLLELGGKNISIVLEDADIDKAANESFKHAIINNGQVCMATDTILVHHSIAHKFSEAIHTRLRSVSPGHGHVISSRSRANLSQMVDAATAVGAKVTKAPNGSESGNLHPVTIIEDLPVDATYHKTESFGPLVAVHRIQSEQEARDIVHATGYGLSCSIFSKDTARASRLGRLLEVGAVHINAGSVHDEANFPHGGVADSGYGRFGGAWAIREFTRTKTIMIHP